MNQISELDLQNLRHLIGGFDTTHCKMEEYASKATGKTVFPEVCPVGSGLQKSAYAVFTVGGAADE